MTEYNKKIELSKRMTAIAEMVPHCGVVADVGCDHGFVSIYLIQNAVAEKVIAMDVNKGPLERAREHVEKRCLQGYIDLRLSDGLAQIAEEDQVAAVVIAGMGGVLMVRILQEALVDRGLPIPELILQPQSDPALLRSFLRAHAYTIVEEKMVCEEGKYYQMLRAVSGGNRIAEADYESEISDAFGPLLLKEKNPVLLQYLQKEIMKFEHILMTMQEKQSQDAQVSEKLEFLKKAMALFIEGDDADAL